MDHVIKRQDRQKTSLLRKNNMSRDREMRNIIETQRPKIVYGSRRDVEADNCVSRPSLPPPHR